MGFPAVSDLTPVTNFQTQFVALVFVLTLVTCRRGWLTSLFAPAAVIFYGLVVRIGGNIQNPLNLFVGQDREDANTYLNIVYPCLALGFSQLAWAWFRLLRMEQWMAVHTKIPTLVRPHTQTVLVKTMSDTYEVREMAISTVTPRSHWGLRVTSPTWSYLFVTFVYVFGAICVGQIIWDQYIPRSASGSMQIAFWVNLLLPFVVGIIYLLIERTWPDAWEFGGTRSLLTGSKYNVDEAFARTMESETRIRVRTQIGAEIVLHLINTFAMTGARLLWTNINNNFYMACGLFGLHLLLLLLIFAVGRWYPSYMNSVVVGTPVDDSGDYYQNLVSHVPLSSGGGGGRRSDKNVELDPLAGYFFASDTKVD